MAEDTKESIFNGVDLHPKTNNTDHHTSEISLDQLTVRRGQSFKLTLTLSRPFNQNLHSLTIQAETGEQPTEHQGTLSLFSLPELGVRSPSAKAVWKVELHEDDSQTAGLLVLSITPPADAPIGEFHLFEKLGDGVEDKPLAMLVVLYNPWCPDDWVYMEDVKEINEYVMNEKGIIFKGSNNYIKPIDWDFGQFEDKMVEICLKILDFNHKHILDPGDDVSARCNPIYVGRVISAMINSQDDRGVLMGGWNGFYGDGKDPHHWTGSHAVLKRWLGNYCRRVKYGQCWVFAGVMCSVMRLLGIPCRVITNYQSAHDNDKNLIVDVPHADYGVRARVSRDSVWNYHVWVEAWMRRPDLSEDGKYDGWQVLDPTPQMKSDGVYCCGPAPVIAVLNGETDIKYDVPYVYAEVNADCIDWLVKADGSKVNIFSDTKRVGQNISTKAVGSDKRVEITDSYKQKEGTEKERSVFEYASTRDYSSVDGESEEEEDEEDEEGEENGETEENEEEDKESIEVEETEEGAENGETEDEDESEDDDETVEPTDPVPPQPTPPLPVLMRFEEMTPPTNGKDVRLKLVLQSESTAARPLSINIRVQAMMYNSLTTAVDIQNELKEKTLQPGTDLFIPIRVLFSDYHKHMVDCDSMKVSVVVTDKEKPSYSYLAEDDVVLLDPPITITIPKSGQVHRVVTGEIAFMNPVEETLTGCSLTLSGSGLVWDEIKFEIPDLKKNHRIRVKFRFVPYKSGKRTLIADFDCVTFRDIKGSSVINVKPAFF